MKNNQINNFSRKLIKWYQQHGRFNLPWQQNRSLYRVWISEIMLQQTQVNTVIPYFERFMTRFSSITHLADASQDEVLHHWSGLGYYARARNLHRSAGIIRDDFSGHFPEEFAHVLALPGIGRSTAGAILAQALGQRHVILDGNVKRVLSRLFAIEGWPGQKKIEDQLWQLADSLTPQQHLTDYSQAIMDFGATICARKADCLHCPFTTSCQAYQRNLIQSLPNPKPRKKRPIKTTHMLVLRNQHGHILLQQRPPSGIWGGLWSLPECRSDDDMQNWCKTQLGLVTHNTQTLPVMRHTFSHFHLDITPVTSEVKNLVHHVMEAPDRVWYNTHQPERLGLPAPVLKILNLTTTHKSD